MTIHSYRNISKFEDFV